MDVGIIDVNTCEPMPNVLVDLWHANTTGHYAGHPDQDPILKWEGPATEGPRKGLLSKYPRTNDHETFLRGAWPTNENGLAQFSCASDFPALLRSPPLASVFTSRRNLALTKIPTTAIFPGYYTGRATHVHLRVHTEWEPLKNGTFRSHRMLHTGQLFVPDSINMQVVKVSSFPFHSVPYGQQIRNALAWRSRTYADH